MEAGLWVVVVGSVSGDPLGHEKGYLTSNQMLNVSVAGPCLGVHTTYAWVYFIFNFIYKKGLTSNDFSYDFIQQFMVLARRLLCL